MIGYQIGGRRGINVSFMDGAPEGVVCSRCQGAVDLSYAPCDLKIPQSINHDIIFTHDLRTLFSEKFIDVLDGAIEHCTLKKVTKDGRFFYINPNRIVAYDSARRKPEFGPICPVCYKNEEVTGAEPYMLAITELPGEGLFRTDVEFSSRYARHPIIISSVKIINKLKSKNLKGLMTLPVFGSNEDILTKTGVRFPILDLQ
jgi:hypothetical protein